MTTATATPRLARRAAADPMPRRKAQVSDIRIAMSYQPQIVGDWQWIGFDDWEEGISEERAKALVIEHGFGVAEKMTEDNAVD